MILIQIMFLRTRVISMHGRFMCLLSQYTNNLCRDFQIPLFGDYRKSLAGLWIGRGSRPECIQADSAPEWSRRRPTAIFRGSATGGGTTAETNMRLKLCSIILSMTSDYSGNLFNVFFGENVNAAMSESDLL